MCLVTIYIYFSIPVLFKKRTKSSYLYADFLKTANYVALCFFQNIAFFG